MNDEANRSDLALNRVEQAYGPQPDDVELARAHVVAAQIGEDEEPVRRRILDFMADHDDVLYRTCLAGHLTGSAMVVDATATRVLLLHHAKLDRWLQPGGHADGDGNLAEVARREAEEETGIDGLQVVTPAVDLDIHAIPRRGDEPSMFTSMFGFWFWRRPRPRWRSTMSRSGQVGPSGRRCHSNLGRAEPPGRSKPFGGPSPSGLVGLRPTDRRRPIGRHTPWPPPSDRG